MTERRTNDDLALGYVLGTLDPVDRALAERLAIDDPAFAAAVRRARADMGKVGKGLARTAARARRAARLRRLPWAVIVGTAAASLALGLGMWLLAREGGRARAVPATPAERLADHVARADLIVVGRVTQVFNAVVGGRPSAVASVAVEEVLTGTAAPIIAAIAPGPATTAPSWAEPGDRFLLFLDPPRAIVPTLSLPQWQVLDGVRGAVPMNEEGVGPAEGFTLDDVRARLEAA